jgi:hypothetical protein
VDDVVFSIPHQLFFRRQLPNYSSSLGALHPMIDPLWNMWQKKGIPKTREHLQKNNLAFYCEDD